MHKEYYQKNYKIFLMKAIYREQATFEHTTAPAIYIKIFIFLSSDFQSLTALQQPTTVAISQVY
jgi:hypothetical protein